MSVVLSKFQLIYRRRVRERDKKNEANLVEKHRVDIAKSRRRKELTKSREKQLKVSVSFSHNDLDFDNVG